MRLSRPAFAWLAVAAWAALIFALSSIPNLGTGLEGWDLVLRKAAHLAEYAVLGALLARALATAPPSQRLTAAPATWAWILGVVYAASDEVHQHFVAGRHGSGLDLLIDAVGVAAGVAAVRLAFASRPLRRASTGHSGGSAGKASAPDDGAAKSAP